MSGRSEHDVPWDDDFWEVSHAAARLTQYACEVAARCLDDGMLRLQFTQEMAYVGKGIVEDVRTGEISSEQGLEKIQKEHAVLVEQLSTYLRLVAGFASGVLVAGTGVAVCKMSLGIACGVLGTPMLLHGFNAMYENGLNIFLGRADIEGPVRKAYQHAAVRAGGKTSHGNVAYGLVDLGLSVYGLGRKVVAPGARRLWHYIDSDKVRAYRAMGAGSKSFELGVDVMTGRQIWVEIEGQ
ncbi:DUF4225 domain-containing protein [Pseudomonas sichuanensis]|uniref:DUF4225 domain-containing protein n=1 Tax=Pseudomonas sichuanensis TaxID=2213015 RepID=UPI00215F8F89|nr:DUF4225 domain-containing protein [Pseudomonas sichuanensis]UVK81418.1 DUF4225 domain-containing protein [Pseudomonas sichuanensis]